MRKNLKLGIDISCGICYAVAKIDNTNEHKRKRSAQARNSAAELKNQFQKLKVQGIDNSHKL